MRDLEIILFEALRTMLADRGIEVATTFQLWMLEEQVDYHYCTSYAHLDYFEKLYIFERDARASRDLWASWFFTLDYQFIRLILWNSRCQRNMIRAIFALLCWINNFFSMALNIWCRADEETTYYSSTAKKL